MATIAVAGLINVETTLRVDGFPIEYRPQRFPFGGVRSTVAGVGFNVAAALAALGNGVRLAAIVGTDWAGALVGPALAARGVGADWLVAEAPETAQAVILYDPSGRRAISSDLKDMQDRVYPADRFAAALAGADLAVVGNINYARPLLRVARERGVPIAADVHAVEDLEDAYNGDWMEAAEVLFASGERLPEAPEEWAARAVARYRPRVLAVGLGGAGALLATADGEGSRVQVRRVPAVRTRPVLSTVGAGDALFAAFVDGYVAGLEPEAALRRATVFASWKIGAVGAAEGFLAAEELDALCGRVEGSSGGWGRAAPFPADGGEGGR